MTGFTKFVEQIATGNFNYSAATRIRDEVNDLIIDTCDTYDMGWETGIKVKGTWIIVEYYEDGEAVAKGHEKWVKECRLNPTQEFKNAKSVEEWVLGSDKEKLK